MKRGSSATAWPSCGQAIPGPDGLPVFGLSVAGVPEIALAPGGFPFCDHLDGS